jgi:hypothetical protein
MALAQVQETCRGKNGENTMSGQSTMRQCAIGNHPAAWEELYCYRDVPNGIPNDIQICARHLYEHVHKFYPGCPNERSLLDKYPEFGEPKPTQPDLFAQTATCNGAETGA